VWQGLVAAAGISCQMPTPREGQRGTIKPSAGQDPKSRSLAVARRLFPGAPLARKKDSDRADALLIARWIRGQG